MRKLTILLWFFKSNQISVNTDWKIVVIYVVGEEVLDVSLHNSLGTVNALCVGLYFQELHTLLLSLNIVS